MVEAGGGRRGLSGCQSSLGLRDDQTLNLQAFYPPEHEGGIS